MNIAELRSKKMGESLPAQLDMAGGITLPIRYLPKRGCRRYVMRVKGSILQVTLPYRYSISEVRNFLAGNQSWIEEQLAKQKSQPAPVETFGIGSMALFRGELVEVMEGETGTNTIRFGEKIFTKRDSPAALKSAIYHYIYQIAWAELPALTREYAAKVGLNVSRVTVRNQKSRWGSCSTRAAISLNWRLVQTPDFVRDYIIYHELMHLRQMNHSAKFWQAVEQVYPDYRTAEKWLKENASLLKS